MSSVGHITPIDELAQNSNGAGNRPVRVLSAPAPVETVQILAEPAEFLTFGGVTLFLIGILLIGSAFKSTRFPIGDLLVHPYFAVVFPALLVMVPTRLWLVPKWVIYTSAAFWGIYFFSTFPTGIDLPEGLKVAGMFATMFSAATLVRSRKDYVSGVVAFAIATTALAAFGLFIGTGTAEEAHAGLNPMEDIGNRNTYSLYALPSLLLAGHIVISREIKTQFIRVLNLGMILMMVTAIVLAGNRSGWICTGIVGLMLFRQTAARGAMVLGVMLLMAYWALGSGDTSIAQMRIDETMAGKAADAHRWDMIKNCFYAGMSSPLIGISPKEVGFYLADHIRSDNPSSTLDSHNVFGHVFAASGIFSFSLMILVGVTAWRWKPPRSAMTGKASFASVEAHRMLKLMILLWAIRGMFTREILYTPGFALGMGLCMGLAIVEDQRTIKENVDAGYAYYGQD